jgi:predicted neutral ceramidase superfamily lipid hydrolase
MLPAVPTDIRPAGPLVLAGVAALAHLVVGWFYLAGGLVVPGPVLVPLWLVWLVLAVVLVRLAVRRSWWTPVVPVAAAVLFVVVLVAGEQWFGWRA